MIGDLPRLHLNPVGQSQALKLQPKSKCRAWLCITRIPESKAAKHDELALLALQAGNTIKILHGGKQSANTVHI